MPMRKKHYVAIAKVIAGEMERPVDNSPLEARLISALESKRSIIAHSLALTFKSDNPSFDSRRFIEACNLRKG